MRGKVYLYYFSWGVVTGETVDYLLQHVVHCCPPWFNNATDSSITVIDCISILLLSSRLRWAVHQLILAQEYPHGSDAHLRYDAVDT